MIEQVYIFIFLAWCSICDIKYMKIRKDICNFCGGILLIFILLNKIDVNFIKNVFIIFTGMIPGITIYIFANLFKDKIGKGDAIVFIIIGMAFTIVQVVKIMFYALIVFFVFAIIGLLLKKLKTYDKLPFIPFVFCGYIIYLISKISI